MTNSLKQNSKTSQIHLLSYEELPDYRRLQENIYIREGYHPAPRSWIELWKLLWSIHSETINIWTHLIGSLIFLVFLSDSLLHENGNDYLIIVFWDITAFITFTSSTLYHWLRVCSKAHDDKCLCIDNFGIELNAYAMANRFAYYLFNLNDDLCLAYSIIQSCIFATTLMLFYCFWITKDYGKLMNTVFGNKTRLLLNASHPILLNISIYHHHYDSNDLSRETGNPCLLGMLIIELILAVTISIHISKFPESIFPGKFDIYFNSHQIMHVLTLFTSIYVRYL